MKDRRFIKLVSKLFETNLFKIAIIFYLVFLLLLGFTSYSSVDQQFAYGKTTRILVSDLPTNKSKQQIENFIYKTAKENNENIFLETLDFSQNQNCIQYAFIGNKELYNKYYKNNKYPSFYKQVKVKIEPYSKIGTHSLIGGYSSTANSKTMENIVKQWKSFGIKIGFQYEYKNSKIFALQLFGVLGENDLLFLFAVLLVGMLFSIFWNTIIKLKENSIKFINGYSQKKIWADILLSFTKIYIISFFVVSSIATIILLFYNGLNQFIDFLLFLIVLVMFYFVVLFLFQIIVLFLTLNKKTLYKTIKGKKIQKRFFLASCFSQIIILLILFSSITLLTSSYKTIKININNLNGFKSINNFVSTTWSWKIGINDEKTDRFVEKKFGKFNRMLDSKGKYLFIERKIENLGDVKDPDPQNPLGNTTPSNSLIVNKKFLELQNIYNAQGNIINSLTFSSIKSKNWAFILIPENKRKIETNIIKHVKEFLNFNYEMCKEYDAKYKKCNKNLKIKPIYTKNNQQINNYNNGEIVSYEEKTDSGYQLPSFIQKDPIILVVNLNQLSNNYLVNSNGYYFNIPSLQEQLAQYHIQDYISSINNVCDSVSQKLYEFKKQQANYNFALILAFLILALSATLISMIYCDANKQVLFAKFSNGYSFFNSMGIFLQTVFTGSIIILSFCVITKQVTGLQNISICLAIILIDLLITIISSKHYYSKMNASFVKRY